MDINFCDKTFDAIAYRDKQPGEGIKIKVEKTNLPEGPCGGNNGLENVSLYDEAQAYWSKMTEMSSEYPAPGATMMMEVCRRAKIGPEFVYPGF